MRPIDAKAPPERARVLTKAVVRASGLLGLKDAELAQVIGVSPPTVSRYKRGTAEIDPDRKTGELALLLVRLFRSLDPLVGADGENRKAWMHSQNEQLGGVPAMLIRRPEGLVQTLAYLGGIRAPA
ncbi:MAG TPA: antitoxin Xre-like helix-turn-helix domain-containing protein [Rhodanobacteraceae bacterium]|nr:antitoxin Xre-like helix-turn-helix domain-containing protein [Rhodanobacteraceae bacterium]